MGTRENGKDMIFITNLDQERAKRIRKLWQKTDQQLLISLNLQPHTILSPHFLLDKQSVMGSCCWH